MSLQSNKVTKNKVTYHISGMDCDSCAKMIELDLEDAGIAGSCNYGKCSLEVEIKDDKDHKKVKEIVEKGGYKLTS